MRDVDKIIKIKEGIKLCHQLQIVRENIDENPIDCIPLICMNELLLIQYLYDFSFDGYKIIRMDDITSVRYSDIEEFGEFILKEEGLMKKVKKPDIKNISNWEAFLKEYKELNKTIIIECEALTEQNFCIGKIVDVNNDSIELLCFDSVGEWEQYTRKIIFEDITSVSFNDRYSLTISKYVK